METRVSDVIIDVACNLGAKTAYVLTGNGAMYLNDAIARDSRLKYVCVRNEAAAPLAAAAEYQLTGRLSIVCVTAGPGSTNAIAGLAEAWVDSAAFLVLSGQVPTSDMPPRGNREALPRSFGLAGFSTVEVVRPITKYAAVVDSAANLDQIIRKSLSAFSSGRPGPVWLDIPLDVQDAIVSPITVQSVTELSRLPLEARVGASSSSSHDDFDFFDSFLRAKKPLILIGRGASTIWRNDRAKLESLISRYQIPFCLTRSCAHFFPLSHPLNLGVLGVRGRAWSSSILGEADAVLSLGGRLPAAVIGHNASYLRKDCKLFLIDIDAPELLSAAALGATVMSEDLNSLIPRLLTEGAPIPEIEQWEQWRKTCREAKVLGSRSDPLIAQDGLFDLYGFFELLERSCPPNTILITDAGSSYYAGGQVWQFEKHERELTSGNFAAMGLALPLAIGASRANDPSLPIVAVTGDGSIELNIQELQTISTYQLGIKVFVINNGGYASMRKWQEQYFESRYIGSTDETGAKPLNFERVALAFDLPYHRLYPEETIATPDFLQDLLSSPGPALIEVLCTKRQVMLMPMDVT